MPMTPDAVCSTLFDRFIGASGVVAASIDTVFEKVVLKPNEFLDSTLN
jgi:hypothetical protein